MGKFLIFVPVLPNSYGQLLTQKFNCGLRYYVGSIDQKKPIAEMLTAIFLINYNFI